MFVLKLKSEIYVGILLIISLTFFAIVASWLKTDNAYTDMLLTIAVVHFVMSKLVSIDKKE